MKFYTFLAYCNYGKGDSGESYVDVELTDEEAELLTHYGTQADIYYRGFSACKELSDIYQKVYVIAVDQMTEEMKEFGDWLDDEEMNDPDWRADDKYLCSVDFPSEFEDVLPEEK